MPEAQKVAATFAPRSSAAFLPCRSRASVAPTHPDNAKAHPDKAKRVALAHSQRSSLQPPCHVRARTNRARHHFKQPNGDYKTQRRGIRGPRETMTRTKRVRKHGSERTGRACTAGVQRRAVETMRTSGSSDRENAFVRQEIHTDLDVNALVSWRVLSLVK
eukprot:2931088-Rhodomonas_salina.1